MLRPLVGVRFQELFHSPARVLFTFPSRYWFTIGLLRVFSLAGWARQFTRDYSCPALLRSPLRFGLLRVRGCHPLWRGFPVASTHGLSCDGAVLTTPTMPRQRRFGLFPGRSPLLGNHSLFSFPAGTKMFQFPAFASPTGGIISLQDMGCPHSRRSRGSRAICASPRLSPGFSRPSSPVRALGIHRTPSFTFACTVPLPSVRQ